MCVCVCVRARTFKTSCPTNTHTLVTCMDEAFATLVRDVRVAKRFEALLAPKRESKKRGAAEPALVESVSFQAAAERVRDVVEAVAAARKRRRVKPPPDRSDRALCAMTRFTDKFALKPYEPFLHYVPRVVNVARRRVSAEWPLCAGHVRDATAVAAQPRARPCARRARRR